MKYLVMIYTDPKLLGALPAGEFDTMMGHCDAYAAGLKQSGCLIASQKLQSVETATTLRMRNGKLSTIDGRSPRPRNSSAASTSSKRATSTRRSASRRSSPGRAPGPSRSGRSWSRRRCRIRHLDHDQQEAYAATPRRRSRSERFSSSRHASWARPSRWHRSAPEHM